MTTRVLIVKLAALGDAVMASTLVNASRRRWPDAHIGWVAGSAIAPFVRCIEGIDEVIEVNDRAMLRGGRLAALRAVAAAWWRIGRRWDVVLVAHTDKRYAALSLFSSARTTIRFADTLAPQRGAWYGEQYMRMVDVTVKDAGIDDVPAIKTSALPAPAFTDGSAPLIVVAPGGARNLLRDDHLRRWPMEQWKTTVRALVTNGYRVIAVGTGEDRAECAQCAIAGAVDYCGKTTIPQLMSLLRAADVVVTHDSGPMHLAIGAKRPVVALFGPTSPTEFVPPGANVTVVSRAADLACAPCYDGNGFAPCARNLCLTRVASSDVVRAVGKHLGVTQ